MQKSKMFDVDSFYDVLNKN